MASKISEITDRVISNLEMFVYTDVSRTHNEQTALAAARAVLNCLYLNFKDRMMYIPSFDKSALNREHEEIFARFNGHNHQELAIHYRRSVQNVYSIIKACRKRLVRKRQTDLFPLLDDDEPKRPITLTVIEEYLPYDLQTVGLSSDEASALASKVYSYLFTTFPGVSIYISESIHDKMINDAQLRLF